MRVTVVWATPGVQDSIEIELPEGARLADAVAHSGFLAHYGLDGAPLEYAIYGRRVGEQARLVEGDRVELTRPLTADPKEMRRKRVRTPELASSPMRTRRQRTS